jgi:CubicO group peptidase (beta-lactamase class C family)
MSQITFDRRLVRAYDGPGPRYTSYPSAPAFHDGFGPDEHAVLLAASARAGAPFFENFWDSRGWGLGLSIVTRRDDVAGVPGRFGWDGAFSTSLYVDPREDMVGVLMAQCRPGALRLPPVVLDFWTSAYQAIDD